MSTGMQVWSATAASNNTADSGVNWQEGQAPSTVNDSARGMMASAAKWIGDNSGTLATSGSSSAFTVSSNQVSTGLTNGYTIAVQFHATNATSATLAVDGLTAAPMQVYAGTNTAGGEFGIGSIHRFTYSSASTAWVKDGHETLVAGNIPVNTITYPKLQNETDNTILGNVQGAGWPAQELIIGTGLLISSTSTSTSQSAFTSTSTSTAIPFTISAPAFPPSASFKKLSIKVTGTSSATVAADYVTMASTGNQFLTLPTASNINFGASGSADSLDTGSLAAGTWYAIYAIAGPTSTAAHGLASTSFTTPLMPSGYTYKARIGALVTSTSTASAQLMGTWQFGKQAQYVLGLAQTTIPPVILASANGSYSTTSPSLTAISVSNFVPSTASKINILVTNAYQGSAATGILVAPSTSWGGTNNGPLGSAGWVWPVVGYSGAGITQSVSMILEGTSIASANGSGGGISCLGWEENL